MKRPKFRPNAAYLTFLSRLRLARQERNCSQRELARRLEGTHWSKIIRSENGERALIVAETRAICEALQISATDFTTELEAALNAMDAEAATTQIASLPVSDEGATDEDVDSVQVQ